MGVVVADLDQSNDQHALSVGAESDLAQTFTAGRSGSLTDVELFMNGTGTITATIYATTLGLPTGPAKASASVTLTNVDAWVDFHYSSAPAVTSGTMYAVAFNTGALAAVWGSTDTYANGQGLLDNGAWIPNPDSVVIKDYAFRTYVKAPGTTPAPTTTEAVSSSGSALPGLVLPLAFILLVGGLLVPVSRRRQQRH
jgi:hypothetical protein